MSLVLELSLVPELVVLDVDGVVVVSAGCFPYLLGVVVLIEVGGGAVLLVAFLEVLQA